MTRLILREEIKKHRRTLSNAQLAATYRRKFRLKYPHKSELETKNVITKLFKKYTDKAYSFMEQRMPPPAPRTDGIETEFTLFLKGLEDEIMSDFTYGINLGPYMNKILEFMLRFKEEEIAEYMKLLTGRPFYATTEWWDETKRAWLDTLSRSITKNINNYADTLKEKVFEAFRQGKSRDYILNVIKGINSSISDTRANFLARDLVGKLNGEVERNLQLSIGIDEYFWQTIRDELVRGRPGGVYASAIPSHWVMESLVCQWNNPGVVSFDYGRTWVPRNTQMPYKHPGEDWQCRCSGSPFSSSLLRQIDDEIKRERLYGKIV